MNRNSKDKKFTNKWNRNNKSHFKNKYGSLQEGHGLAYLQRNKIKKEYLQKTQRENQKERKNGNGSSQPWRMKSIIEEAPDEELEPFDALPFKKRKLSKLKRAQKALEEKQREKLQIREDKEIRRKEIEEKRKTYKAVRLQRNIKLSKKTRKGQPLMKSRMEFLLQNLEETLAMEQTDSNPL